MISNRSNVALILVMGVFVFLCTSVAMGAEAQKQTEKALTPAAKAAKRTAPAVAEEHIRIEKIYLKKGKVHVKVKNTGKLSAKEHGKGRLVLVHGGNKMAWPLSKVGTLQQFNAGQDITFNTGLVLRKTSNIRVSLENVRGDNTKQVVPVPLKLAKKAENTAGTKLGSGPGLSAQAKASGDTIRLGNRQMLDKAAKHTPWRQPELDEGAGDGGEMKIGINILRPVVGTRLHAGNTVNIRWGFSPEVREEYGDSSMPPVRIAVRNTVDIGDVVLVSPAQTDTEMDWEIPANTPPGGYSIVAVFETEPVKFYGFTTVDILSSNDLVLIAPPVASTTTDTKYVGLEYYINWNAVGEAAERDLKIELLHSGVVLHHVIASSIPATRPNYSWLVGGDCNSSSMVPIGESFRVKVSTIGNPVYESTSAPFNIELPTIIITPPGNGLLGSRKVISWSSYHMSEEATLKITLLKGGSYFQLIAENVPNTNNYTWEEAGVEPYTGPATNASTAQRVAPPGSDYRIHIEMEDCDLVTAVSNQFYLSE